MPYRSWTGMARLPLVLLEGVERLGFDRPAITRAAGIDEDRLHDPDGRIPLSWTVGLWEAIVRANPDPDLGVRLGRACQLRELGLVGYTMLNSETLMESIDRLSRFGRIVADAFRLDLERRPDGLRVGLQGFAMIDSLRRPADYRLSRFVAAARELTGVSITPVETQFPYPDDGSSVEHRQTFGDNLVFDAPAAAVVLRTEDLARPAVTADSDLGRYLDRLAEQTIETMGRPRTFADQVRQAIWTQTNGTVPTIESTATALGVSVRSLQRKLAEEETDFSSLRDEFRHQLAVGLLRERDLSIQEIAYLLGYGDHSAFHRAFRRWESIAPRAFREQHVGS